ncbi:hypothetical protein [Methanobrevibacter sp.]|uniref:hypothetical protein n=1 Tax=Methanobrevibacter sp. TaxID=66852 RepID=UPI0039768E22
MSTVNLTVLASNYQNIQGFLLAYCVVFAAGKEKMVLPSQIPKIYTNSLINHKFPAASS